MDSDTTVVTGATGKTGRRVAQRLTDLGQTVRAVSRSRTPPFDWADPTTWEPVLRGATGVYLVAPDLGSPWLPATMTTFAQRATAAGVRRAVLLSAGGGGPFEAHVVAAEQALLDADLDTTVLRPRWFHQNFSEDFLRDAVLTGEVRLPAGDGRDAFVDADDIAEVAVTALTKNGHAGRRYELCGPRLMSFGDAVDEIARLSGRDVRYVPVTSTAYAEQLSAQGVPEHVVRLLGDLFEHVRSDALASRTDDVRRVLGRDPRDFTAYATSAAARGAWHP